MNKPSSACLTAALALMLPLLGSSTLFGYTLPDPLTLPYIPTAQAPGSVTMGDPANFAEVKMDFPIESGQFSPTWDSITSNYPSTDSAWLRQAKFGIWVHFGPQSAGLSGDWYARKLYIEGQTAYTNHINAFGHPSTVGYKDLIRTWNPTALDPSALTTTYFNAGARFLLIQGVHHDQYDNWNSKYQPWNSMNLAPKRDFLGEWRDAVRAKGMHFGVTFHHEYSWWWWQSCYRSDVANTYGQAGVNYDGHLTDSTYTALGTGQWWQGMDLRDLYNVDLREYAGIYNAMDMTGYNLTQGIFVNHLEFAHWYATRWALRILDVIENYDPDFIYTDGNSTQPFSGYMSGSGYKCDAMQRVLAHYFNRTLERRSSLDTFGIVKFSPYNKGVVNTFEGNYPTGIKTDQAWIGEVPVGDWYYAPGFNYDPGMVIRYLLECVSRDGGAAICIALKPDGSLDPGSVTQLQAIGSWMSINSAAIYGSRAWAIYGEGSNTQPAGSLGNTQANATFTTSDFRYTVGADGYLYAFCMKVPAGGTQLTLTALGTNSTNLAAPITSVALLGSSNSLTWSQTPSALNITCSASMPFQTAVCFKIGPTSIIKPPAPTGLNIIQTDTNVVLNWNSPLVGATFTVKRSTSINGPFTSIASGVSAMTYTDTTAVAGTTYFYSVSATQNSTTSADSSAGLAVQVGTTNWPTQDVGSVGVAGSLTQSSNSMLVSGSGADIWGTADAFRYVYQSLNGDGSITAKVESMQNTAAWAKAGLMFRDSLNANSIQVIDFLTPTNGIAFQQRVATGGSTTAVTNATGMSAPYWLRLKRSGTNFTAYQSADGASWTTLGSTTSSMGTNAYVGLAVCSVNNSSLCQAFFSNVSIKAGSSPMLSAINGNGLAILQWSSVSGATAYRVKRAPASGGPYTTILTSTPGTAYVDTGLTNATTYYYEVSALTGSQESADSDPVSVTPSSATTLLTRSLGGAALANAEKATETAAMAFDGSTNTKWFTDTNASTGWLRYQFGNGLAWTITEYKITSANDTPGRDPMNWLFQGSIDGTNWTTLDTQSNQTFASRYLTKTYDFNNPTPYPYYRLNITANYGGSTNQIQLSELTFLSAPTDAGDKTLPVVTLPSSMTVATNNPAGAIVNFNVTATDAVSGTLIPTCTPSSGSLFAPGVTSVQCSASDLAGNTSTGSFTITVNLLPATPNGLATTIGDGSVGLSWNAVTNALTYNVYRSLASGSQGSVVATNIAALNFNDSGLSNGTTYYYTVSGVNVVGEGLPSTQIGATPLSGYQQWLASNNLAVTNSGSAMPDGDGVPLLLKYAAAMTPGMMSTGGPVTLGSTNNHLRLQFNRLAPATQEYVVEATSDLTNWSTIADLLPGSNSWTGTASVAEVGSNTPISVTVTDTASFTTNGKRYLRLRIPGAHGTIPQGYRALTLPPLATTALSLPLDNTPAARGLIQGVGTNTLSITNAGTWTNAVSPYAIRLLSGNASGATFSITGQSNAVLTVANQGVDLTQLVATNDSYEMLPIDTLGGFFGTNGGGLQTGTTASSSDNLQLWNGTAWIAYYNNGTNWKLVGSALSQNNTQLPPGAGWLIVRKGSNALSFYAMGQVPEVPIRSYTKPGGQTFLAGPYPTSMTLSTSGFTSAAGWQSGSTASTADNVQLWNGSAWIGFYYNGTNWKLVGSALTQDAYVLIPGQPMFIQRRSTPTPAQSFILHPKPYTP
jgi:alpha-L-fucosidase